jgi:hypothetical protein
VARGRSLLEGLAAEHLVIWHLRPADLAGAVGGGAGLARSRPWYWPSILATVVGSRYSGVLASGAAIRRFSDPLVALAARATSTPRRGAGRGIGFFSASCCRRVLSYHFVPVVALVALVGLRWLVSHRDRTLVPAALVSLLLVVVMLRSPWDGVRVLTQPMVQRAQEDPNLPPARALQGPAHRRIRGALRNPASVTTAASVGARFSFGDLWVSSD